MITVIQNQDVYEISFPYDPNLVFLIKQVPGKSWKPERKTWTVPRDKLGFFLNQVKGTPYQSQLRIVSEEQLGKNEELEETKIPDIAIDNVDFLIKEGATPYKHQLDFMKFAINRQNNGNKSGFMVCDSMGLGKTAECISLAHFNKQHYNYKHCLIICCVNMSKYNWQADIEDHSRGKYKGYILGTRLNKHGDVKSTITGSDKLRDLENMTMYGGDEPLPYFIITNIESFRMKSGKHFIFAEKVIELINKFEINMICIDEIHKNASTSSSQGKQLLAIKAKTEDRCMWIPVTGTPIVNKPTDCYLPLKLIDATTISSFHQWASQFCVYGGYGDKEIIGYKNIPRLKFLVQNNMIRRLKENILDLPDKIQYVEYVDNTPIQAKLYESLAGEVIADREAVCSSLNPMSAFLKLRQVNGSPELFDESIKIDDKYYLKNAKFRRLLELLVDIHERNEKVIIFSNWLQPLRTIYKLIRNTYGTAVYVGSMTEIQREQQKNAFMNNPKVTVMLGTIGAMGTSLTLTAANNVIFYDCPWTMTDFDQACDRVHRIGTTKSVSIYKLITRQTVDNKVDDILFRKKGISQFIVDNIDIRNNPQLFNLLLQDSIKR